MNQVYPFVRFALHPGMLSFDAFKKLAAAVSSVESKVDGRLFSPSETGMALDSNLVSQGLGLDTLLLAS